MKVGYLPPGKQPGDNVGRIRGGGMDTDVKKIVIVGAVAVVLVALGMWGCSAGDDKADAQTAPPTEAVVIQTLAPLPTVEQPPTLTPVSPLEPAQLAGTATAQALYSRPAFMNDPAAYPSFVGVITLEDGCLLSNIGFTTSGYNGKPYFLYLKNPLDRNPTMEVAQVQGYIQQFDDCAWPVIMVDNIIWFNGQGTPSPISYGGPITGTATITATAAFNPAQWGMKTTPIAAVSPGAVMAPPVTATPYPTYTPFPTATPYVPPPRVDPTRYPTYTPYPTPTPNPATPSPTPTVTPQAASVYGDIVTVVGCQQTNLAVANGGQSYFIVLAGAQLPGQGNPVDYWGLVTGHLETVCNGPAIRANQIIWYAAPTPVPSPTSAPTNTPAVTSTPTTQATALAETPTAAPTVTATNESNQPAN
jgi:hypothetical protein